MTFKKKIFYSLITIFIITFITEVTLNLLKPNYIKLDPILGWKLKNNFTHTYQQKNYYKEIYNVNFSTDYLGMRTYSTRNNSISNANIFVFGDSFTTDPYASNDEMWYSHMARSIKKKFNNNINIYAVGAGGYGTLQSYLNLKILKEKFNFNKIDLFIYQFCNNDFHNNFLEIEKKLYNYNQYSRRPFLVNSKIVYDDAFLSKLLRLPIIGESRILNKIFFMISKIKNKGQISKDDLNKSFNITKQILYKIKNELNNTKVLMINCSLNNKWPYNQVKNLADLNNFYYFDFPVEIIENKKNLFIDGSHLSNKGNQEFGEKIFEYFLSNSEILDIISVR